MSILALIAALILGCGWLLEARAHTRTKAAFDAMDGIVESFLEATGSPVSTPALRIVDSA